MNTTDSTDVAIVPCEIAECVEATHTRYADDPSSPDGHTAFRADFKNGENPSYPAAWTIDVFKSGNEPWMVDLYAMECYMSAEMSAELIRRLQEATELTARLNKAEAN